MRFLFSFVGIVAFGLVLTAGCGDGGGGCGNAADGTACAGGAGTCRAGKCQLSCSEEGILEAVELGGGPYTFDCDGERRVVTRSTIAFVRDVTLDGEGKLIVDGNETHRVFNVPERQLKVTLRGMTITGGVEDNGNGGGIANGGTLTLERCTLSGNTSSNGHRGHGGAIYNTGTLELLDSTVSGNSARGVWRYPDLCLFPPCEQYLDGGSGGGIANEGSSGPQKGPGVVTLVNTTVSGNRADDPGGGIASWSGGYVTITNSTLSGNWTAAQGSAIASWGEATVEVENTVVEGDCSEPVTSLGNNIEGPADTCGFDQPTDQVNVPVQPRLEGTWGFEWMEVGGMIAHCPGEITIIPGVWFCPEGTFTFNGDDTFVAVAAAYEDDPPYRGEGSWTTDDDTLTMTYLLQGTSEQDLEPTDPPAVWVVTWSISGPRLTLIEQERPGDLPVTYTLGRR